MSTGRLDWAGPLTHRRSKQSTSLEARFLSEYRKLEQS